MANDIAQAKSNQTMDELKNDSASSRNQLMDKINWMESILGQKKQLDRLWWGEYEPDYDTRRQRKKERCQLKNQKSEHNNKLDSASKDQNAKEMNKTEEDELAQIDETITKLKTALNGAKYEKMYTMNVTHRDSNLESLILRSKALKQTMMSVEEITSRNPITADSNLNHSTQSGSQSQEDKDTEIADMSIQYDGASNHSTRSGSQSQEDKDTEIADMSIQYDGASDTSLQYDSAPNSSSDSGLGSTQENQFEEVDKEREEITDESIEHSCSSDSRSSFDEILDKPGAENKEKYYSVIEQDKKLDCMLEQAREQQFDLVEKHNRIDILMVRGRILQHDITEFVEGNRKKLEKWNMLA